MKPHIICHMLSSVDGKIDASSLRAIAKNNEYETIGALFGAEAWVCGRTTMHEHFAEQDPFVSNDGRIAGPQPVYVARRAESYAVAVDTLGKLQWASDEIAGDHLICITSERVSEDYLAILRQKGISYVVAGKEATDLVQAVDRLGEYFGIATLLLEGGGHINGAFLEAHLVDEVSLLVAPGIDGRHDIPSVFDGISSQNHIAFPLKLKSIQRRENDTVWLRYNVVRPQASKE